MTFADFLKKWNGKYLEVAGSSNALNQCVDLANAYIRDVLGLPIIEWTNAVDFPSKAGDKYEWIPNTPEGVPQEGDIVVWKPSPGHIAIFMEGNTKRFTSFDQNFPVGSFCHVQEHTYLNVTGWLRPKSIPISDETVAVQKPVFETLVNKSTERDTIRTYLSVPLDPLDTLATKVKEAIEGLRNLATGLQRQLSEALQEVKNRIEQVDRIKQTYEASAKTDAERIDALEKAQVAWGEERGVLREQVTQFAKEKGEALNEKEVWKTKYEQAADGAVATFGSKELFIYWIKSLFTKRR
jgi:hypothetical protein